MAQEGALDIKNHKKLYFSKTLKNRQFFKVFGTQGLPKSVKMAPKMAQDGFRDLNKSNRKFQLSDLLLARLWYAY